MKKTNFKKLLSIALACVMIVVVSVSGIGSVAFADENVDEFTELQSLHFITNENIIVPDEYKEDENLGSITAMLMNDALLMPTNYYPYNYTVLKDYAVTIRKAMNAAGIRHQNNNIFRGVNSYSLLHSTLLEVWSSSFVNYNCYGYAINRKTVFVNPGYHSGQNFSMSLSIRSMADLVVDDLKSLDYWAYVSTSRPTVLERYEKLICIRKGSTDYHFMKIISNQWTHKPGGTSPLKYNYANASEWVWTNEHSYMNVEYEGNTSYDSTVLYIIYWPKNVGPQPKIIMEDIIYE